VDRVQLDELMGVALDEARAAVDHGDVPIGAVVVRVDTGEVVTRRHNQREQDADPTAHAEMLAMREAARAVGGWRLERCTLYVTLEPCAMCAGAAVLARIPRVVFAAGDPKAGFAGSLGDLLRDPRLNHRAEVVSGVLAEESGELLRRFFQSRRGNLGGAQQLG